MSEAPAARVALGGATTSPPADSTEAPSQLGAPKRPGAPMSAAKQSILVLGIRVGGAVLQMLLVATVALRFSVTEVGLNGILWAVALVARMAGPLGLDVMGLRSQSPLWAEGRNAQAVTLARRYSGALVRVWGIAFGIAAVACAAMALGGGPGAWFLSLGIVAVTSAFMQLYVAQRQARNWPLLGQFMESIVLPALGLVGALVTSVLAPDWLIASQVMAFVLVTLILYAASPSVQEGRARRRRAASSASDVPFTGRHARAVPEPGPIYVPRHASRAPHADDVAHAPIPWRPALTVGAGNALTSLCVRGPMFVIGGQSLAAAGVYEVAQKIQSGGAMGTSAVATVFAPRIAVELRKPAALIKLLVQAGGSSLVVPLGLLAFLFVVGSDGLVAVLGDEYQGAWAASVVLVVSTVINAITSAMSNVMMLGGRERMFAAIAAVQMLLVVGGALVSGADTAVTMAMWVLIGEAFRSACMVAGLVLHLRAVRG
ncbi:hypothetical protein CKW39_13630 [Kocuria sp. WRN011]|uniref:lipopolysaccharide biosynthesis protein n=1 Tax=Kocuria sp. WRN011 TaxID=2029858 RepID=UPI000BAFB2BD|nr:hypothetical protein [Kocuria sp. WRN011]PBB07394.1 hypothetical protein CKW39_13630 [Kocuria sp. WRN011]